MRVALRIGGLLIAAAIMWILIDRIGAAAILNQLTAAGPGFIWILVLHAAAIAIAALPWYYLLPEDTRPTVGGAIASRFVAQGANAMLPMFGLGGELVRLLWLRKGERAPGIAAIIVDRLAYAAASAVILVAGFVGLSHIPTLPSSYTDATAIGIVVLLAVVGIGALLARRYRIAGRIQRLVRRMRKKYDRDQQFGDEIDHHVERMLARGARTPWLAVLLHVVARGLIGAEIVLGFWLLDAPLVWDAALLFIALPIMVSVTGALVPNQFGVLEGAYALVAASVGVAPSTAVAVVLLVRLRQLAGVAVIGVLLLVRRGSLHPAVSQ